MAKTKTTKRSTKNSHETTPDDEVQVCRRRGDRRTSGDAAKSAPTDIPQRRKVQRRRQIDPTTCERDYSQDEIEFMHALDAYKRANGRMFPTCSEILEVVRGLGYQRVEQQSPAAEEPLETVEMEGITTDEQLFSDAELISES